MKHTWPELYFEFQRGALNCREFSSAFENWWNFEAHRPEFTSAQQASLNRILDVVALYSPFPDDFNKYSGYKSEIEVRSVVDGEFKKWFGGFNTI